jgi:nucleoside-diphosphate-sugar epimerase
VKNINIFCYGFGQVAKSFVNRLSLEGFKIHLSTTNRSETTFNKIGNVEYKSYKFENNNFDEEIIDKLKNSDHILISIPPIDGNDIVINNFSDSLKISNIKWITYLSATSVYGNHKGEWVNELSKTHPTSPLGISRLKVEEKWLSFVKKNNLPLQIFRLSGVYSNKNNPLLRLKSGNANIINKPNHFFSRIHVEDIANVLLKSLTNFKTNEIYNISDDKPASSQEVMSYAAKILKTDLPKTIDEQDIKSEMLKNFYKDSKKVSNQKMKKFFSYNLKFPTYIEGLNNISNNLT